LKPKTYWMNTSGNAFIKTLIERAPRGTEQMQIEKLIAGEPIRKVINEQLTYNEIYDSMENIWSLLFMTGYLTFTEEVEDSELTEYYLRLPNKEVQRIFVQQVMAWFKEKSAANTEVLSELYDAFKNGDTGIIKNILDEQLIDCISYHDAYESFYHGFLLALLLPCRDWNVTSNRETGKGRNDILIEALDKSHGIVIEIKNCRDGNMEELCDEALRQIEERDYTAVLRRYRFKEIRIYGIAFWDKECMVKEKKVK
ncbi:MAG: PD-(D/E)XK nuclease domain-containing protein, partial [Clostridia bacterium]|nr:PD-(D/E)XK nuclease domain-containing protein [Clostridia bacterium]